MGQGEMGAVESLVEGESHLEVVVVLEDRELVVEDLEEVLVEDLEAKVDLEEEEEGVQEELTVTALEEVVGVGELLVT